MGHPSTTAGAPDALEFPSAARAARHAARLWLQSGTGLAIEQFLDQQFQKHCEGRSDSALERSIRRDTFDQAFDEAVGRIAVKEARLRAAA
jgi:hypothetical protein